MDTSSSNKPPLLAHIFRPVFDGPNHAPRTDDMLYDPVYRCREGEPYTYIDESGVERWKSNLGEVKRHYDH